MGRISRWKVKLSIKSENEILFVVFWPKDIRQQHSLFKWNIDLLSLHWMDDIKFQCRCYNVEMKWKDFFLCVYKLLDKLWFLVNLFIFRLTDWCRAGSSYNNILNLFFPFLRNHCYIINDATNIHESCNYIILFLNGKIYELIMCVTFGGPFNLRYCRITVSSRPNVSFISMHKSMFY